MSNLKRKGAARKMMELVLIEVGNPVGPVIDGLTAEPEGCRELCGTPEVVDRVPFFHVANGKRVSHCMSSGFTTPFWGVVENRAVGKTNLAASAPDEPVTEKNLDTLAGRFKHALAIRRMNSNQLAERTGIARQTFYAVLHGTTKEFNRKNLVQVCGELRVRQDWLADGIEPMFPILELQNDDEVQLIRHFRKLSDGHKKDLAAFARHWSEEDNGGGDDDSPRSTPPKYKQ